MLDVTQPPRPGPAQRVSVPTLSPSSKLYFGTEAGGSALLLVATVLALAWANSPWSDSYAAFWSTKATLGVDDIGAITVMAIFYTEDVHVGALVVAALLVTALLGLRWAGVWRLTPYVLVGIALWLAIQASGVHPTLAGVLVGLLLPARPPHP